MLFRKLSITSVIASIALFACGNKIPVESPAGAGSNESATQAAKASTDEISSKLYDERSDKSRFGHHGGRRLSIDALTDSLGLSDEQVSALEELNESFAENVKAAIESARASGDRKGLRVKLRELRKEYEKDFNDVLTDEQHARLEEIRANAAVRRKDQGWENTIAALTDTLGLSDAQVADLNELYEDYQADVKTAIENAQESGDRSELRTSLKVLRQAFEDAFNDVLTDEQQARLEEIRANAAARRKNRGWENTIAALTDSLGLSDEQVADLNELYEDYQADVKAAIENAQESGDRSELREKLQELRENFAEDFTSVLTDEQKEKLDEMKSEGRKRKGKGRRHGHKGRKG